MSATDNRLADSGGVAGRDGKRFRLGVSLTHPIQYWSPLFRELARRPDVDLTVHYAMLPTAEQQGAGFGVAFEWDVPLLDGYRHQVLRNVARNPGFTFSGCNTPEIASIIRAGGFDAWLVPGWHSRTYLQAITACKRYRVPVFVRGDSNLLHRRPLPVRLLKRILLGTLIPRFDAYLTVGTLAEAYYRHYGADPRRFFPSRHFVDNAAFEQHARGLRPKRDELRRVWGIAPSSFVALFCGKFMDIKRPRDLIRAAASIGTRDVRVLMVGDGPLRPQCELLARETRAPVTFAGFLNQTRIPEAYAASDVLVLPSAHETWGLVVNEAMASGLPTVVSSMVGCAPDLICPGQTGAVFPVGDVAALSARLGAYAANPGLARSHGAAAQRHVRSFDVAAATDGVISALRRVVVSQ